MTSNVPYLGMSFPDNSFECHASHVQRILCDCAWGHQALFFLRLPRTAMERAGCQLHPAGDLPQGQVLPPCFQQVITSHYNSPSLNFPYLRCVSATEQARTLAVTWRVHRKQDYQVSQLEDDNEFLLQKSDLRCTSHL